MGTIERFSPYVYTWWGMGRSRCAIDWTAMALPITSNEAEKILESLGYIALKVDLANEIDVTIGISRYRRGARPSQAPAVLDCSLLTWWAYQQLGIELPRYSLNQRAITVEVKDTPRLGDVVFKSGWRNYFQSDPSDGVGHVGIVTNRKTVVHAANPRLGVIETSYDEFTQSDWRGTGRVVSNLHALSTFTRPTTCELTCSLDLRCMILQRI